MILDKRCASANFDTKTVTTDKGRGIPYNLLLGADDLNSQICQFLTTNNHHHYHHNTDKEFVYDG